MDHVVLRRRLDGFRDSIAGDASANGFVDEVAAARIVDSLIRLPNRWSDLNDQQRARVAATAAYVVDPDDEEHDRLGPIGLVDDEERVPNWSVSSACDRRYWDGMRPDKNRDARPLQLTTS